jgi:proline dehydrogenase
MKTDTEIMKEYIENYSESYDIKYDKNEHVLYKNNCICGREYIIYSHADIECCEYVTDLYIPCDCGEKVLFIIPVR